MSLPSVPAVRRGPRKLATAVAVCLALVLGFVVATAPPAADAADPAPTARSGNLLSGDNSGFETSTGAWKTNQQARLARVTSPTHSGTGALSVTNTTTKTATYAVWSSLDRGVAVSAQPGFRYVARAQVRAQSKGRLLQPALTFLDSTGRKLDRIAGQPVMSSTSGWTQSVDVAALAPSGATAVAIGFTVLDAAAGERHYVDSVVLTEARGGAARVVGPLRTSGNRILDANGNPIVLRGVNRSGMERNDQKPMTQTELERAKAWGANVVRIPLGDLHWLTSSCVYDSTYAGKVDEAVRLVTGLGMVALLNLHWSTTTSCGTPGLIPGAAAPGAITFWKQVAARYKSNPLVAFDLYNEPHHLTDAIWRDGGAVTWKNVTYQVAGMQQMYDAVRSSGATNLVMASGNSWANLWPKTPPLNGSNIVYAIHLYTCPTDAPPKCTNPSPYDPEPMLKRWVEPGKTYPLMVTEFGWPNPEDGVYIRNLIRYADGQGWSWSVYTWSSESWSRWSLVNNTATKQAYQPRPVGMPVLAAFPGS